MSSSIQLSEKHGVNPSINVCFWCNKDKNEIILPGKLKGDVEAPHRAVWNKEPCDECRGYMEQGVILISVDEAKTTDKENPWRSGGWCVLREEAIRRIVSTPELLEAICKKRVCFIPDDAWEMLGLPRGTK